MACISVNLIHRVPLNLGGHLIIQVVLDLSYKLEHLCCIPLHGVKDWRPKCIMVPALSLFMEPAWRVLGRTLQDSHGTFAGFGRTPGARAALTDAFWDLWPRKMLHTRCVVQNHYCGRVPLSKLFSPYPPLLRPMLWRSCSE